MTKATTYGVKSKSGNIMVTTSEFKAPQFVGVGGEYTAKEWKTRKGAEKTANRFYGEVFEIIDGVMQY